MKTLYVDTREKWRTWLKKHHASETEVWLIYYKKHTGRPRIPYDDAVEEALCFGWIDSIVKRVDENTFAQKFTPRRNTSKWSALNQRRVEKLIREGRMTEAGLSKIPTTMPPPTTAPSKKALSLPADLEQTLRTNDKAWDYFNQLAPSYRRHYVGWITSAKRQETREKRMREAIELLAQSKKLGLK